MTALAPVIRVGNNTPIKTVIRTKGYKTKRKKEKQKPRENTLLPGSKNK